MKLRVQFVSKNQISFFQTGNTLSQKAEQFSGAAGFLFKRDLKLFSVWKRVLRVYIQNIAIRILNETNIRNLNIQSMKDIEHFPSFFFRGRNQNLPVFSGIIIINYVNLQEPSDRFIYDLNIIIDRNM